MYYRLPGLFSVLFLSALSSWGQPSLHLFFTGGIDGIVKSEAPREQGDMLRIQAVMRRKMAESGLSREEMLLFDTGDALAYNYLSQMDSGRTVFRHMLEAGYDGMVVGNYDFQYGMDHLRELSSLDPNFVFLGANVSAQDSSFSLAPYRIFERLGLRIGVVGVVEPSIGDQLVGEKKGGIRIEAPVRALRPVVDRLRGQCDLLIAVNHMGMDDNLELVREVPGIDILIGRHVANDSLRYLRVYDERERPRTILVSVPPQARAIGHIEIPVIRWTGRSQAGEVNLESPLPVTNIPFDAVDLTDYEKLETTFQTYVRTTYDGHTPDEALVDLSGATRDGLMDFALFTLLKSTHSEIALLNYGSLVSNLAEPKDSLLTIRDVLRATQPFDPVTIMRLSGRSIKAILNRSKQFPAGANRNLRFLAVNDYDKPKEPLQPHGLALQDNEIYAVATTQYLAEGGDGYDEFRKGTHRRWQFTGRTRLLSAASPDAQPVSFSDLLIRFLLAGIHPDFNNANPFFQEDQFINKPLLLMTFQNIDFSFKSVRVDNNEAFSRANDRRVSASTQDATNIATAGYLALIRRTGPTRWENGALFRYGFQQLGNSDLQESDDRLELQTILDWDNPFGRKSKSGKLNLYSSVRFDTEFSRGETAEGQALPRRKDGYFYFGISNFGKQNREIRLAFFAKNNFNTTEGDAGFELNAKYFKSFRSFRHGSVLRARYLFQQPDRNPGDEQALIDYTGYLEFNLIEFINLKPQVNAFVFRDMALGKVATNLQFSVALSFSRLWKPQYIRFWRKDK